MEIENGGEEENNTKMYRLARKNSTKHGKFFFSSVKFTS
jgi:hypothetical protein